MVKVSDTAHYLEKLAEFEQKYGVAWVKKTYSTPPQKGSKFYEFAMKMHAAYIAHQNGSTQITNNALSASLMGSLNGFNGVKRGKSVTTAEGFYEKWIQRQTRRTNHKQFANKVLEEALAKKSLVLMHITKLLLQRDKEKTEEINALKPVKVKKLKKADLKPKEQKPLPHSLQEQEPTAELDIYYTDGGTSNNGSPNQRSRICVVKNGEIFIDEEIGNKTNNEAEYEAMLRALKDTARTRKAIIYSDSQLIVYTVHGKWKVKNERLKPLHQDAQKLFTDNIQILWVPRERNKAGHHIEEKYSL